MTSLSSQQTWLNSQEEGLLHFEKRRGINAGPCPLARQKLYWIRRQTQPNEYFSQLLLVCCLCQLRRFSSLVHIKSEIDLKRRLHFFLGVIFLFNMEFHYSKNSTLWSCQFQCGFGSDFTVLLFFCM